MLKVAGIQKFLARLAAQISTWKANKCCEIQCCEEVMPFIPCNKRDYWVVTH
jgi:hypothetical protein